MEVFTDLTGQLVKVLGGGAPNWAIWVSAILVLLVIIFLFKNFLDIAVDIWKMPFAIFVDVLDLMAFNYPMFNYYACVAGFVSFWFLAKRGHWLSKILAFVVAIEALIGPILLPQYANITNVVPTATILMFVAIWYD